MLLRICGRCPWDKAIPTIKDPDRQPDPTTVRLWGEDVDEAQLVQSFALKTAKRVAPWLEVAPKHQSEAVFLSWLIPALEVLCPLRC